MSLEIILTQESLQCFCGLYNRVGEKDPLLDPAVRTSRGKAAKTYLAVECNQPYRTKNSIS